MKNAKLPANWPRKLYLLAFVWGGLASMLSGALFGKNGAIIAIFSALALIWGFRITELLAAVMVGVRKANGTGIAFLIVLKLGWWVLLFWSSRHVTRSAIPAIGIGFGSFLLAIVSLALWNSGLPRISTAKSLDS